jgi:hypothetical protein
LEEVKEQKNVVMSSQMQEEVQSQIEELSNELKEIKERNEEMKKELLKRG